MGNGLPHNGMRLCMQGKYKELWLESVRSVFEELDTDGDGLLDREQLIRHLSQKLSPRQVKRPTVAVLLGLHIFE